MTMQEPFVVAYVIGDFKGRKYPLLVFDGGPFEKLTTVTISGFDKPKNGQEAVRFALQAMNRYFEQYLGDKILHDMDGDLVKRKREVRQKLNALDRLDLTGLVVSDNNEKQILNPDSK